MRSDQVFKDLADIVNDQQQEIDSVESMIERSNQHAKSGLKQLNISYESLVFDNEKTMSSIEQFLGVQKVLHSKNSSYKPQTHIIRGNRTAFQTTCFDDLKYDSSWMPKFKYCIMIALVPWVMVFNRCQVYSYIKNN